MMDVQHLFGSLSCTGDEINRNRRELGIMFKSGVFPHIQGPLNAKSNTYHFPNTTIFLPSSPSSSYDPRSTTMGYSWSDSDTFQVNSIDLDQGRYDKPVNIKEIAMDYTQMDDDPSSFKSVLPSPFDPCIIQRASINKNNSYTEELERHKIIQNVHANGPYERKITQSSSMDSESLYKTVDDQNEAMNIFSISIEKLINIGSKIINSIKNKIQGYNNIQKDGHEKKD